MRHTLPVAPQFYVTASQPCPYLDGKVERKLFTGLADEHGKALNDTLSKQGFRRSQNVLYRPSCANCAACLSARIRVADFKPRNSHKRILRKNRDLMREAHTAWATDEQYDLFKDYLETRHADGGMADMDMFEFAAMVEETPVQTRIIEYFEDAPNARRKLQAASLTDILDDGLSMVYSFFNPDRSGKSPGTHMILDHIALAQEMGLDYVYLGYWVPGSPKMDYKAKFSGLEVYIANQWQALDCPEDVNPEMLKQDRGSILEQVATIKLPDVLIDGKG
ncbi:putative arginyl-tRNA--protein transferase [Amylibacter ulvae]|uniref:Aspartate/glutamate leucyltransferase n=1 Tax=Paramylibacter ulvae TaxID=1651968 RepID=A0ABQ3CT61_9RHOB|nr:arginyltransferase [Amylibacter ulvae]GHA42952.1 putative arginyl-tRNA--protein transferase [Amylibacter ulvae]